MTTWLKLPQNDPTMKTLVDKFPSEVSSASWIGGRDYAQAWLNLDTGSLVFVRGVGEQHEAGFVMASIRFDSGSTFPLAFAKENRYASTADVVANEMIGFPERFDEVTKAVIAELSLSL
jgi:hypothetical protein